MDWNAKLGSDNAGCREHVMGPYGIGDRNDRGERLLQCAQEKVMYMLNTQKQAQQEVELDVTGISWQKYDRLHISTEELV